MDRFIEVGQIVNTHGLKGEVKVNPWTDAPEVFEDFEELFFENGVRIKVEGVRYQKACVLLKLSGVCSIDDAERLKGRTLLAHRDLFDELPEDTYLVADIVGLEVREGTITYGNVSEVFSTGSNDVYVVKAEGARDILIPALRDVICEINVPDGYIEVKLPKGLIE